MQLLSRIKHHTRRLLKWSERYTKTDMLYVTKSGFWVSVGQGLTTVSGLALSIAFANLLPKEAFGTYKYFRSVASIIAAFSLTGMGAMVVQSVARGYEGSLRAATKMRLKWGLLMMLIAFCGAGYYFFQDNAQLATGLLIIGVMLPIMKGFSLYGSFLQGKQQFRAQAVFNFINSIVPAGSLIALLFFTDDPLIILFVYFIAQTITAVGLYTIVTRHFRPNTKQEEGMSSFGKHLSVMNVFSEIGGNVDKILLWHFLGPAQLAIYTFALAPVREISKPKKVLMTIAFPKLSKRRIEDLKASLPYRVIIATVALVPFVLAYILVAPYLYALIFPQYMDSVIYSQVFAAIILVTPMTIFGKVLTAHAKQKQLYIVRMTSSVFKIVLLAALVPLYGLWGAIAALMISRMLGPALSTFFLYRTT